MVSVFPQYGMKGGYKITTLRPGLPPEEVAPSAQQKCIIVFYDKQPQTNT